MALGVPSHGPIAKRRLLKADKGWETGEIQEQPICAPPPSPLQYPAVKTKGTVYLVGAGPGDAGLLTLRGAELLGRADVVVHDALVNPDLLRLAPPAAEIIFGGKRGREHVIPQDQ